MGAWRIAEKNSEDQLAASWNFCAHGQKAGDPAVPPIIDRRLGVIEDDRAHKRKPLEATQKSFLGNGVPAKRLGERGWPISRHEDAALGWVRVAIVGPVIVDEAQLDETKSPKCQVVSRSASHRDCGQRENIGKRYFECARHGGCGRQFRVASLGHPDGRRNLGLPRHQDDIVRCNICHHGPPACCSGRN